MHAFFNKQQRGEMGEIGEMGGGRGVSAFTASAKQSQQLPNRPWIERYRPATIHDISSQEETVQVLERALHSDNLPHMLFYGPPGTGKTSTILALARQLFGPELFKSRVLELNASDERGIDVIREKVKNFAKTNVSHASVAAKSEYPCPPFKIIILDEADSMTEDAQSALRRVMENYSKITRFCLICNYVSRIIEPLTSRCAKFRFRPLATPAMRSRLRHIAIQEGVSASDETLDALISVSGGDMRKAVMFLESAHQLYQNVDIPVDCCAEIAGTLPDHLIDQLLNVWHTQDFSSAQSLLRHQISAQGYSATRLLSQIQEKIITSTDLSSREKSIMSLNLARADKYLVDGCDEYLQLLRLLSSAVV